MVDEVLESVQDLERLSFYGLSECLGSVQQLLERVLRSETAKAPRADDLATAERKEELLEAQAPCERLGSEIGGV